MGLRDFINNNSAVATIGAVVVLVIALGAIIMMSRGGRGGGRGPSAMYFFDEGSGKIFVGDLNQFPPIDTPSGPNTGVQAFIFGCGDCGNFDGMTPEQLEEKGVKIAWLQKFSPEAKKMMMDGAGQAPMMMMEGAQLIRSVESKSWVPGNSPDGVGLQRQIRDMCSGGRPQPCYPGR